jgi:hypothetical protein
VADSPPPSEPSEPATTPASVAVSPPTNVEPPATVESAPLVEAPPSIDAAPAPTPAEDATSPRSEVPAPAKAAKPANFRRRRFVVVAGALLVVGSVVYAAVALITGGPDHPVTAKAVGALGLHVVRQAHDDGPGGQVQFKIQMQVDDPMTSAMTLPFGPGGHVVLLTSPLPGQWKPSVAPRGEIRQLPLDAYTFGGDRQGAVTAVPPNPVSQPKRFTNSEGKQQSSLVSTMKDVAIPKGGTLPSDKPSIVVFDVPDGTVPLALAIIDDDGFVKASQLVGSFPKESDPTSF